MRYFTRLLPMIVVFILAACSNHHSSNNNGNNNNNNNSLTSSLIASGGTSTNGTGGTGGYVYIESYGSIKVLKSGTLDTTFSSSLLSRPAPSFGDHHYIVSTDTTVQVDADDPANGELCAVSGDPNIYIGNGDSTCDAGANDVLVTGLTVNAGTTLNLGNANTIQLSNDLEIYGTITAGAANTIYIDANIIGVESGGKITSSATSTDTYGGDMYLGNAGMTQAIINLGTIEAKGSGTGYGGYVYLYADDLIINSATGTIDASGGSSDTGSSGNGYEIDIYLNNANNGAFYNFGSLLAKGGDNTFIDVNSGTGGDGGIGGYVYIDVPYFVVNTGTIDVSGGSSEFGGGGSGGELDVYVNYGDFHSTGTVRMNGGSGATYGGDTEAWNGYWYGYSAWIETAYSGKDRGRNGDIIIGGTWEANGGDASNGNGGQGGYIYLEPDALGAVTMNASMSVRGGNGTSSGGSSPYGIEIYTYNNNPSETRSPGKIRVAGQYDLSGGSGEESGGSGGYFYIWHDWSAYNASSIGSDMELIGFASMNLNGGDGASGGSAYYSSAFQLRTDSPNSMPAGPITNEARIEAKGGQSTATGNTGGSGGNVAMLVGEPGDSASIINNSGAIDVSGGVGDYGGSAFGGDAISMQAQHVTNSGDLSANGGAGTTAGGNGSNITLNSLDTNTPTTNTGTLSAAGGSGATPGSPGTITIDGGGGPM